MGEGRIPSLPLEAVRQGELKTHIPRRDEIERVFASTEVIG
jgi:hypothetical protein